MHKVGVFEADDAFDVVCSCGWRSTGWPATGDPDHPAGHAVARAQQHADEHRTGQPAQELHDFRAEHGMHAYGVTLDTAGAVHVIDATPAPADEPADATDEVPE